MCHTVQTRCHLEKFYITRQAGNRSNAREQSRFCGTTTEQAGVNTVTVTPGCSEHRTRGAKKIIKNGTSNTTNGPGDSTTSNNVGPDAMTWASTWEMMNRTLEAFATRNTDSSERGGGKSRKNFKKPKEFKDDSDGCIDTWVEVMRLHLEQDNLNDERQACTAILSNLEGTALKCVVAKKEEEHDTADKILILLNQFGSGMKGHQAMMRFEKRRQRDDESIDQFLDDLESWRRRSDPEESTNRRNFSIDPKFIDRVKSDDLRTILATYYTLSKDNAPTPETMRLKSREYMLMKPKKYSYPENRNLQGGVNHIGRHGTSLGMIWTNAGHAQISDQRIITWRIARPTSKA